ncbi:hypothetical protein [Shewanella ulleungensis]|uniref:hypothetical protein n=1 Tax=Shewanella ulleungensis TaxID=2282699 RepID=UPI003D79C24B
MNKIKAIIQENDDGAYYHALLSAIPRPGEEITFYSYQDKLTAHQSLHHYVVLSVSHDIHDVTDNVAASLDGFHQVTILVEKQQKLNA